MSSNAQALLACPVCGGRRLAPLRAYRRAHLTRCRECGLVFAGRRPSEAELADHYGGYSRADYDSPITRQRYRELLAGFEQARDRGWEAQGTEFERRAVEIVRAKGLSCAQAPTGPETFEPGSFDVVTAFEVVEHVGDPRAEATAIAAALRPGGLLYLTTPNFDSLSRRLLRGRWSVVSFPEHLSYFTPTTLRSWLARAGFEPVAVTTTGVSLARLRRGLSTPGAGGGQGSDEQLREQIEGSRALRAAKRTAEALLGATRTGDTIKGSFELRS
jgi:SAM-dependent methyltransferase